ncbi:hypothetical protein AAHH79_38530, partial [Burkholderia pseudomallei]
DAAAGEVRVPVDDRDSPLLEPLALVIGLCQNVSRVAAVVEGGLRGLDVENRAREKFVRLRFERRSRILFLKSAANVLRQR